MAILLVAVVCLGINCWGLEDSLANKLLALQAQGPEFHPQNLGNWVCVWTWKTLFLLFLFFYFWNSLVICSWLAWHSLCKSSWPWTWGNPPTFASRVLVLQVYTTMPSWLFHYFYNYSLIFLPPLFVSFPYSLFRKENYAPILAENKDKRKRKVTLLSKC